MRYRRCSDSTPAAGDVLAALSASPFANLEERTLVLILHLVPRAPSGRPALYIPSRLHVCVIQSITEIAAVLPPKRDMTWEGIAGAEGLVGA